jgi:hypothetical protein
LRFNTSFHVYCIQLLIFLRTTSVRTEFPVLTTTVTAVLDASTLLMIPDVTMELTVPSTLAIT